MTSAEAALIRATGPGTSSVAIEHGVYSLGPTPLLTSAQFDPIDGQLITPGSPWPTLATTPVFLNTTGYVPISPDVPLSLTTPSQPSVGFEGAHATLVNVVGAHRAGVAIPNFNLFDNTPNGFASTSTMITHVDYVNDGPSFSANFGHFIATQVDVAPNGYTAFGFRTRIEVGTGVGDNFSRISEFSPQPIVVVWTGDFLGVQAQAYRETHTASRLDFEGISYGTLGIAPGRTVRIHSTLSLIADPQSSFTFDLFPVDYANWIHYGMGAASNAPAILTVPEPSSITLLAIGAALCGWGALRRRTTA